MQPYKPITDDQDDDKRDIEIQELKQEQEKLKEQQELLKCEQCCLSCMFCLHLLLNSKK